MVVHEETEVRRARRSWPVQYQFDILAEIDEAKARGEPGAVGAICRREGLYSSLITRWRQQRDEGPLVPWRGCCELWRSTANSVSARWWNRHSQTASASTNWPY